MPRVLLFSHDAERAGAPRCLLEIAPMLQGIGCEVHFALCGGGDLRTEFERRAPVTSLDADGRGIRTAATWLIDRVGGDDAVIVVNTVAVPDVFRALADCRVRDAIAWVHELPEDIDRHFGGDATIALLRNVCRRIIAPSNFARRSLMERYGLPADAITTIHNGIPRAVLEAAASADRGQARTWLRDRIGAPDEALIVLGAGMPERRKGVDHFARVGAIVCGAGLATLVHFVWAGRAIEPDVRDEAREIMRAAGFEAHLHFLGELDSLADCFAGSDLVVIPARRDPSPLVNAEAMAFRLPVVYFEDGGGAGELQPEGLNLGVPDFDIARMAGRVMALLSDAERRTAIGDRLEAQAQTLSWAPIVGAIATQHDAARATQPRARKRRSILMILPDFEVGGGQINAIRLANALSADHEVFVLNARPAKFDAEVAALISAAVEPLEGTGGALTRDDRGSEPPNWENLDERPSLDRRKIDGTRDGHEPARWHAMLVHPPDRVGVEDDRRRHRQRSIGLIERKGGPCQRQMWRQVGGGNRRFVDHPDARQPEPVCEIDRRTRGNRVSDDEIEAARYGP